MSEIYKKALAFRVLAVELGEYKDKHFPIGAEIVVYVTAPRYEGFGIAVKTCDCPPDHVPVRLENGNVWHYPIEGVVQNDEGEKWPAWIKRLKTPAEAMAFEVEVSGMVCIVFAATTEKARWTAVKCYREAYGNDGSWPHVQFRRAPELDKSSLNVQANWGRSFGPEYARGYPN